MLGRRPSLRSSSRCRSSSSGSFPARSFPSQAGSATRSRSRTSSATPPRRSTTRVHGKRSGARLSGSSVSRPSSASARAEPRGVCSRSLNAVSTFPTTRLRRLRRTGALRDLVRETRLHLDDFVMPLFVGTESLANSGLPAMGRFSVGDLVGEAQRLAGMGVRSLILFGTPEEKDEDASGAYDDDGIVQQALL